MSLSADDIASIVVGSIQEHGLCSSFNFNRLEGGTESSTNTHNHLPVDGGHLKIPAEPTQPLPAKFPSAGDLVWGRMPGFPFWPSFVTKGPTGQFRKESPHGKTSYHVQFFNWNDESGWVNAVIKFDGLDSFKQIAAKKKSDKSYNPSRGAMKSKWEKAAREADETLGLTRHERCQQYQVNYGTHSTRQTKLVLKNTARPKTNLWSSSKTLKLATTTVKTSSGQTGKIGVRRELEEETEGQLPIGWKVRKKLDGGRAFLSPDGREFKDKASTLKYLACLASLASRLPSRHRKHRLEGTCQHSGVTRQRDGRMKDQGVFKDVTRDSKMKEEKNAMEVTKCSKGENRRMVGPKSVMRRLELECDGFSAREKSNKEISTRTNHTTRENSTSNSYTTREISCSNSYTTQESSTSEDEDPDKVLRLPNGMKYRRGGEMENFLDLDKLFDPSNGGFIEMAQLPESFLDHPSVSVEDCGNEIFLSSALTGQIIAKKIVY